MFGEPSNNKFFRMRSSVQEHSASSHSDMARMGIPVTLSVYHISSSRRDRAYDRQALV